MQRLQWPEQAAGVGKSIARPFRAVRHVRGRHVLNEDLYTPSDIDSYEKIVCFFFYAGLLG